MPIPVKYIQPLQHRHHCIAWERVAIVVDGENAVKPNARKNKTIYSPEIAAEIRGLAWIEELTNERI